MAERAHSNENNKPINDRVERTRIHSLVKATIGILALVLLIWIIFGMFGSFYEEADRQGQITGQDFQNSDMGVHLDGQTESSSTSQQTLSPGTPQNAAEEPRGTQARPGTNLTPEAN